MKVLVAGVGNIFFGDDAFGVEVARRMSERELPDGVRVVDFGIRGYDLAYALMDGPDLTILVDAVPRGGAPGTIYAIAPDLLEGSLTESVVEGHSLHPLNVFRLVRALGGTCKRVVVVGCEPATLEAEGLSPVVEAALPEAIAMIDSLIDSTCTSSPSH
jgi:hydrogenase maturation protease